MDEIPMSVSVTVDQRTLTKTLTFDRPLSPVEAANYLFGSRNCPESLRPIGGTVGGRTARYLIDTRDVGIIMQLRPEVRDAIIRGSVIGGTGRPVELPAWVPAPIREDIRGGRLTGRVTRYPGQGGWGDIVVWKDSVSVQVYQEFPESLAYYSAIASGGTQAHLLHYAYTQYNKDMRYFVETKGVSPEYARAEIRRINEEVFKLIIEGAVALLGSGASITQVNNAIRMSTREVSDAARRSPRLRVVSPPQKVRPVNGEVNVGGGFETPRSTNLNPAEGVGGGPISGIPNHVKGKMEQMDMLFEPGSVDSMVSSKLRYVDVNWREATRAAAKVMRPGGKVEMNIWCSSEAEKNALVAAFESAGFKDVTTKNQGVLTFLSAVFR